MTELNVDKHFKAFIYILNTSFTILLNNFKDTIMYSILLFKKLQLRPSIKKKNDKLKVVFGSPCVSHYGKPTNEGNQVVKSIKIKSSFSAGVFL